MIELKALGIVVEKRPYLQVPPSWNSHVNLRSLLRKKIKVANTNWKTMTVVDIVPPENEGGSFVPAFFKLYVDWGVGTFA